MATRRKRIENAPLPSPFPEGWYFISSRADLVKSRLIQRTWMGEHIIAWCDANGGVCVAEAFCPHLGADLGPDAGGRICDGRLVCPFHGYEFDASGQCVATPYADPPKTAKLRVFETQEVLGLIFAWWGIEGRAPQWSLPDYPREEPGWTDFEIRTFRFAGHPQETTENSVDLGHLRYVHGYANVDRVARLSVDGACLNSDFDFRRVRTIARVAKLTFDITAKNLQRPQQRCGKDIAGARQILRRNREALVAYGIAMAIVCAAFASLGHDQMLANTPHVIGYLWKLTNILFAINDDTDSLKGFFVKPRPKSYQP